MSSLRAIVTIRLSCGTWSRQILLILMSVISLKSQKVCHWQNKRNRRQKLCIDPQNIYKNPDKVIWISPQLRHNFHWFESRIPQWPEPERQLNGSWNGWKRDPRGRSRCPEKAGCQTVQSGTWASGCSHLPGSSQSSSRNAWGCFGSENVPPSFVSLCQRDVTLEGTIYSWNRNSQHSNSWKIALSKSQLCYVIGSAGRFRTSVPDALAQIFHTLTLIFGQPPQVQHSEAEAFVLVGQRRRQSCLTGGKVSSQL